MYVLITCSTTVLIYLAHWFIKRKPFITDLKQSSHDNNVKMFWYKSRNNSYQIISLIYLDLQSTDDIGNATYGI